MIAPGNEATIARQKRQAFGNCTAQQINQIAVMAHHGQMIRKGFGLCCQAVIAAIGFVQKIANRKGTRQAIAHRRQITRTTTPQGGKRVRWLYKDEQLKLITLEKTDGYDGWRADASYSVQVAPPADSHTPWDPPPRGAPPPYGDVAPLA